MDMVNQRTTAPTEGRNTRRKERTRAALVRAAQELLASGNAQDASIQAITDRADVGFGSFFNHFASKTELFDTALTEVAQRYEDWLDSCLGDVTDPLRRLALSIRLTGRLHVSHPQEAELLFGRFALLHAGKRPLSTRVREDVVAAIAALPVGTRPAARTDVTAIAATGAIAAVLAEAAKLPDEGRAELADALVADVLRLLGVDDEVIVGLLDEPLD